MLSVFHTIWQSRSACIALDCVLAFRWCILPVPSSLNPLLYNSSSGVNRMYSCVNPFFLLSCLSLRPSFVHDARRSRQAFLSDRIRICTKLLPSLFCQQMVLTVRLHEFDLSHISQKTSPISPTTPRSPHLFLSRKFACHRKVQVAHVCPYTVTSDISCSMLKYKQIGSFACPSSPTTCTNRNKHR